MLKKLFVLTAFFLVALFLFPPSGACKEETRGFSFSIDDESKISILEDVNVSEGEKLKDVVVIGADLDFAGEADNVVVIGGNAKIQATSKINDDLAVIAGKAEVSKEATIGGKKVSVDAGKLFKKFATYVLIPGAIISVLVLPPLIIIIKLALFIVAFGIALLLFHVFPKLTRKSKEYLKTKMLPSFLYGLIAMLLMVPILLFFLVSIVGIPLIPFYAIFLFLILLGGLAVSAHYVGTALPHKFFKEHENWALLAGMLIICLVCLIPIIGPILKWLAVTVGVGACIASMFGLLSGKKA